MRLLNIVYIIFFFTFVHCAYRRLTVHIEFIHKYFNNKKNPKMMITNGIKLLSKYVEYTLELKLFYYG